jgi:hypothetical protein
MRRRMRVKLVPLRIRPHAARLGFQYVEEYLDRANAYSRRFGSFLTSSARG